MFIELTDHLRCPEDHPEQYLVLLPTRMEGRRVIDGELGCPLCGRVVALADGAAIWEGSPASTGTTALTAEAVAAFLGLGGPGGYVALVGNVSVLAPGLAPLLTGVRLVMVNPPADSPDGDAGSVLRAPRLPLKTASMRGIVVGSDYAADDRWMRDAAAAVLPGLRLVGESRAGVPDGIRELARSDACWVGVHTARMR